MSLKQQLTDDMKQAMRDRNTVKLGAVRFLLAEIRNYEIDHGEQDDAGIMTIIARQVKQINEAMQEFEKADRADLVEEEKQKVAVLSSYLPAQLSDEELSAIVDQVMAEIVNPQMGAVMQAVKAKVGTQADGSKIAALVKSRLS